MQQIKANYFKKVNYEEELIPSSMKYTALRQRRTIQPLKQSQLLLIIFGFQIYWTWLIMVPPTMGAI